MAKADKFKKYQVYFFLYLAVICELLIVIVERDDAEESLLIKQRELERKNRLIILELLKNMPAVAAAGDNQLKVGESRSFTIRVKGLGERDEVTTPPTVHVYKDGSEIQTLHHPSDIIDSTLQSTTGERLYRFTWKAEQGAGTFDFHVEAGTNRIELVPDPSREATVKVGTLDFSRDEIQAAIDFDENLRGTPIEFFIRKSENLDPAKFTVEVISEAYDQLQILAENITTAVGFDAVNEIKIRGTTADKISNVDPSLGVALDPRNPRNPYQTDDPEKGKWVWTGKFNEPGIKTVNVAARDRRAAGQLSVAKPILFTVNVKDPFLRRRSPRNAYGGELFSMNIDVHGLESANEYSWRLELDGQTIIDSVGPLVRANIREEWIGRALTVRALYDGKQYLWKDSVRNELLPSDFEFRISPPVDNVYPLFEGDGTLYPQNFEFGFEAYRCGVCLRINERAIDPSEISVEAVKSTGAALPVTWVPSVHMNDKGVADFTKVSFRVGGRVNKNGEAVLFRISAGQATEEITVRLRGN